MKELEVNIPALKAGSYKIKIAAGSLSSLWDEIEAALPSCRKFVVTDENLVSAGHLKTLIGQNDVSSFIISPAGEDSKNINTVISIIDELEKASFGRDSVIIALGGGTVGDIAGFVAAIFKRGVSVVQIPTTTVSQADSAVGGKTGVDSTVSKNAIGAFWPPVGVFIDVTTLSTLDDRQYRAGLVESVKHALIADAGYFEFLEKNMDAILVRDSAVLEQVAYFNCKIKAAVVEQDPTEQNQRRMLNYGHTIGHAAETVSGFALLHGEAIAIGIMGAGLLEIEMGLSEPGRLERVGKILKKLGVPLKLPADLDEKSLIEAIQRDKKAVNKWPKFVLLEKIGYTHRKDGQWAIEVGAEAVKKVLCKLKE